MIRHYFSYWLKLKGNPDRLKLVDAMARRLISDYLVPDIDGDIPKDELRYCVDPDYGTIEEWRDAEEIISKLANAFPDIAISLSCSDEEDSICSHNHVWHNGKSASAYGRLVIADVDELMAGISEPAVYASYDAAFDALGWSIIMDARDGSMTISKHSPAGEYLSFEISGRDIPREVRSYADDFDVDDHVDLWGPYRGENGVPRTFRALVEDAEAIQSMLDELADALESVKAN